MIAITTGPLRTIQHCHPTRNAVLKSRISFPNTTDPWPGTLTLPLIPVVRGPSRLWLAMELPSRSTRRETEAEPPSPWFSLTRPRPKHGVRGDDRPSLPQGHTKISHLPARPAGKITRKSYDFSFSILFLIYSWLAGRSGTSSFLFRFFFFYIFVWSYLFQVLVLGPSILHLHPSTRFCSTSHLRSTKMYGSTLKALLLAASATRALASCAHGTFLQPRAEEGGEVKVGNFGYIGRIVSLFPVTDRTWQPLTPPTQGSP